MTLRDSLAQVVALLDRATPGPWEIDGYNDVTANGEDVVRDAGNFGYEENTANIELIVAAVAFLREHGARLQDMEVAVAQAVEFAEYVERQAKGAMVDAAKRFLSAPYAEELRQRLNHRHSGGDGEAWRSIKTAPRTGEIVLLASIDDHHVMVREGKWDHLSNGWTWPRYCGITPTLWMPLPPRQTEGEA